MNILWFIMTTYQCNQCGKAFTQDSNLKKAPEDTHWGETISM